MTTPDPPPSTETVDGTPPPTGVQFHVDINQNLHLTPTALANRIATIRKILEDTVQALNEWVFSPEFNLRRVEYITIQFLKPDKIKHSATIDGAKAHIYCSDQYVLFLGETDKEHITRVIFRNVMWLFGSHFDNESYPDNFILGILNYVRLKKGCFRPSSIASQRKERIWYGKNTMPYFLDFLEGEIGEGTVLRIFAALGSKYDKGVFQKITDKPITDLWKMYRATIPDLETDWGEEWISDLDELWPIPELGVYLNSEKDERLDVFMKIINKPLEALAKAVLAVFKHLYTPKTASIKNFHLLLSSKTRWWKKAVIIEDSTNRVRISLDYIVRSKPTEKDLMGILIGAFYRLNAGAADSSRHSSLTIKSDLNTEDWAKIISKYLLFEEGLAPPLTKTDCDSSLITRLLPHGDLKLNTDVCWHDILASFFFWIETTNKGTMRKFYKLLKQRKYDLDESCFVKLIGKTLDGPWHDFTTGLPDSLRITHFLAISNAKEFLKKSNKNFLFD